MDEIAYERRVDGSLVMTGGWLLADLLLPEPWGDVVLFGGDGGGEYRDRLEAREALRPAQMTRRQSAPSMPKNPTNYEIRS